jgi:hypothetical protein
MSRTHDAVVLACDLEGYSRLPVRQQLRAFQGLQDVVAAHLGLGPRERPPQDVHVLPTGDGLIVCDLRGDDGHDRLHRALHLSAALLGWAAGQGELLRRRGVAIGIAGGPVLVVRDINGHRNVVGRAINEAARFLAAAEPWAVLVQQGLWDEVAGRGEPLDATFQGVAVHIRPTRKFNLKIQRLVDSVDALVIDHHSLAFQQLVEAAVPKPPPPPREPPKALAQVLVAPAVRSIAARRAVQPN